MAVIAGSSVAVVALQVPDIRASEAIALLRVLPIASPPGTAGWQPANTDWSRQPRPELHMRHRSQGPATP